MPRELDGRLAACGARFPLFPDPEVVAVSVPPDIIGPGPAGDGSEG